jgi:hypothetical protein
MKSGIFIPSLEHILNKRRLPTDMILSFDKYSRQDTSHGYALIVDRFGNMLVVK